MAVSPTTPEWLIFSFRYGICVASFYFLGSGTVAIMRLRHIGAIIIGLVLTVPVLAKQVVYKTFNDWIVACDNTGRCEASGASEEGAGLLVLTREAGANGAISLTLYTSNAIDMKRLRADKKPVQIDVSQWQVRHAPDDHELATQRFDVVLGALGQMRQASRLYFSGSEDDWVSLSGLNAALLLLDDTQKRLDTETALLRRGTKPATNVPEPEPVPQIRAAALPQRTLDAAAKKALITQVRQSQKALLKKEECSPPADTPDDDAGAIDEQHAVVLIECLRGAYQSSAIVFKVPFAQPKQAQRLLLEMPLNNKDVGPDRDMVTMGSIEAGVLTHSARGRGFADCGESASWVWNGQAFQLTDLAFMDSCRGFMAGYWPVLWRAKAVR
jgi:hypothetical protein